jgi:hypothetical protein
VTPETSEAVGPMSGSEINMSKAKASYSVIEVVVAPMCNPTFTPIHRGLSPVKALALASELDEKQQRGPFDPNRIVCYMAEAAN